MEDKIQKRFERKYGEGNWVRFRKYVKQGLSVAEIEILLYGMISYDTISRLVKKLRGGDK